MANFTTHIAVGTVVAGSLATVTLAADVLPRDTLVAATLAGVLGSVLPDIDLKDSRPSRMMFSGLGIFFSFAVLFTFAPQLSIAEMFIAWLGTLVLVRYGGEATFHRLSYHRGIFHSILAGVTFWFLTAIAFRVVFATSPGVAWLAGAFLFAGYMTHLVLDELYSVDIEDRRIKASFGTALKFIDGRHLGQSAAMAAVCAAAFLATPPATGFLDGIASRQLWSGLESKLLPKGHWFGIDPARLTLGRQAASDVTTGAIPAPAGDAPIR